MNNPNMQGCCYVVKNPIKSQNSRNPNSKRPPQAANQSVLKQDLGFVKHQPEGVLVEIPIIFQATKVLTQNLTLSQLQFTANFR